MTANAGKITPNGVILEEHEYATVLFLTEQGYDVELIRASTIEGTKSPDIRMSGFVWEMKSPIGKYTCYKGSDGYFYTITDFGDGEYLIEYTENEETAKAGCFWDADWFYGDPDKVIPKMRAALFNYVSD